MIAAFAAGSSLVSMVAHAGLSDFYVTNTFGEIYQVDGQTLESNQVSQLGNTSNLNEILYIGNGEIIASLGGTMLRHNINTGAEEIVFRMSDHIEPGALAIGSGLAMTTSGDIFFTASIFSAGNPTRRMAGSYNLATDVFVDITDVNSSASFFDHHQIGTDVFISADHNRQIVSVLNGATGDIVIDYNVGFGVVSFFESDGGIFAVGRTGGLYSFDIDDGSTEYIGDIAGVSGDLIGATVPASGSFAIFGLMGIAAVRRRR